MAEILYGAPVREEIKEKLKERIKKLEKKPVLAIVQVGDRPDSNLYIKNKIKFGEEIGVEVVLKKFKHDTNTRMNSNDTDEDHIIKEVEKLNEDENISGIIVQLPLPEGLDTKKILQNIKKEKDADGLAPLPLGEGVGGGTLITPATARAVLAILDFYKIEILGKKACVIGQSLLAGRPISDELEKRGGQVERCDINTKNVPLVANSCDILISAVGKIGLVNRDFVNGRQVVIDVGINTSPPTPLLNAGEGGKPTTFVGDVDFQEVESVVKAITPVPGGVGPVTVACLFQNLLDLCYHGS